MIKIENNILLSHTQKKKEKKEEKANNMNAKLSLPAIERNECYSPPHYPSPHITSFGISQSLEEPNNKILLIHDSESTDNPKFHQVLTTNANFLNYRSPFYEVISRHCVMPLFYKQLIQFTFNLPIKFVSDIHKTIIHQRYNNKNNNNKKRNNKDNNNDNNMEYNTALHIRLFDIKQSKHCAWERNNFEIYINKTKVELPIHNSNNNNNDMNKNNESVVHFVQPLDISNYASKCMSFEIICRKTNFYGAAAIEVVSIIDINNV